MSWWSDKRVMVTGGHGFLGSVLIGKLKPLVKDFVIVSRREGHDLTQETHCEHAIAAYKPDVIFHLAAVVGGIGANMAEPGRFLYDNAVMGLHLIEAARRIPCKFVAVGTICAYPKEVPIPFKEESLWDGYPEPTNAPYGLAKKLLLVQLQAYRQQYGMNGIYLIPTNLYGPGDHADLEKSHVIPAIVRKMAEAQAAGKPEVHLWGTGEPSRDFLYVDDAADALILAAERYNDPAPLNLGTGEEVKIKDLTRLIADLMNFHPDFRWDHSKPDGQPRRCVDSSRAEKALGWKASTTIFAGMERTIEAWRKRGA